MRVTELTENNLMECMLSAAFEGAQYTEDMSGPVMFKLHPETFRTLILRFFASNPKAEMMVNGVVVRKEPGLYEDNMSVKFRSGRVLIVNLKGEDFDEVHSGIDTGESGGADNTCEVPGGSRDIRGIIEGCEGD